MDHFAPLYTPPHHVVLDSIVDIASFNAMHLDLCRAVALSDRYVCSPGPVLSGRKHLRDVWYEFNAGILPPDVMEKGKGLTGSALFYYLALTTPCAILGEYVPIIAVPGRPTNNVRHFMPLLDWIYAQRVIQTLTKLTLFITPPNANESPHVDHDDYGDHVDEFLWFRLSPNKTLYLTIDGQQVATTGTCLWFNGNIPHASVGDSDYAMSLRIDGAFTPEFREKISALIS